MLYKDGKQVLVPINFKSKTHPDMFKPLREMLEPSQKYGAGFRLEDRAHMKKSQTQE